MVTLYKKDIEEYLKNSISFQDTQAISPYILLKEYLNTLANNGVGLIYAQVYKTEYTKWSDILDDLDTIDRILIALDDRVNQASLKELLFKAYFKQYLKILTNEFKKLFDKYDNLDHVNIFIDKSYLSPHSVFEKILDYIEISKEKQNWLNINVKAARESKKISILFRTLLYSYIGEFPCAFEFHLKNNKIIHVLIKDFQFSQIKCVSSVEDILSFSLFKEAAHKIADEQSEATRALREKFLYDMVYDNLLKGLIEENIIAKEYSTQCTKDIPFHYHVLKQNTPQSVLTINFALNKDYWMNCLAQTNIKIPNIYLKPYFTVSLECIYKVTGKYIQINKLVEHMYVPDVDSNDIYDRIRSVIAKGLSKEELENNIETYYSLIDKIISMYHKITSRIYKLCLNYNLAKSVYEISESSIKTTQREHKKKYLETIKPINNKSIIDIATYLAYTNLLTHSTNNILHIGTICKNGYNEG
jgi:hypothetical protein